MAHDLESNVKAAIRGVLREMGFTPQRPKKEGPRVLFVVQGHSLRQDEALVQVQAMEQAAGKASLVLTDADRLCGGEQDVKEKSGTRCLLSNVPDESFDRVLALADWLVVPTVPLPMAARAAALTGSDDCLLLKGLLAGKKTLIANDSFRYPGVALKPAFEQRIAQTMATLQGYGIIAVPLDQLAQTFLKAVNPSVAPSLSGAGASPAPGPATTPDKALTYVSAREVREALDSGKEIIRVAANGLIGPLALDLAREGGLKLQRESDQ